MGNRMSLEDQIKANKRLVRFPGALSGSDATT